MKTQTKHYAHFLSPGTLFDEETSQEIAEWDTRKAVQMAGEITERYGAKPFGFRFTTVTIVSDVPDGRGGFMPPTTREDKQSPMHFIAGRLKNLAEVEAEYGANSTIAWNMRVNKWPVVVETQTPWKHTSVFANGSILLDADGTEIARAPA